MLSERNARKRVENPKNIVSDKISFPITTTTTKTQ